MDLGPGMRMGPYEIVDKLGAGGMGVVYRARDSRLNRWVALKVLRESLVNNRDRLRRFETEARAAGALNHPNILAVFDAGTADGVPYVVTELLAGETLRDRMTKGALREAKAIEFAIQIAEGLGVAHEHHVIHRDLKPENVFVTNDGRIKILDFGLAKLRDHEGTPLLGSDVETRSNSTEAGSILGTVGYMSPEQVRGAPADYRSDIFSFGAVFFEMLTGHRAFKKDTSAETMTEILRTDPMVRVDGVKNLGLLHVLGRCLEKKPEDRFQSARDLSFHLRSLTEGSGVIHGAARRGPRLFRWPLIAAALVVGAAAIGLVAGRSTRSSTEVPVCKPLTFGGVVWSARFGPDDSTVYYTLERSERPMEVFSTWRDSGVSQTTGVKGAKLLSVSRRGEMAVLLRPSSMGLFVHSGTLAQVSVSGGTPRELLNDVLDADFSPNGETLAVVRWVGDRTLLEFPMGRTLYETAAPAWISKVRVSPDGHRVAFIEHEFPGDLRGGVSVVDMQGARATLASEFNSVLNVVWTNDRELQFSGSETALRTGAVSLYAVPLGGPKRRVASAPGNVDILDAAPGGRVLLRGYSFTMTTLVQRSGNVGALDLSDRESSFVADVSADGRTIVGTWQDSSRGANDAVYMQHTDATSPVRLGDGQALALSPDQKWVLTRVVRSRAERLALVPTGTGESRELPPGEVKQYSASKWFPDGKHVIFSGTAGDGILRLYVQDVSAGPPHRFGAPGFTFSKLGTAVSPDGRKILALSSDNEPVLFAAEGGGPAPIPRLIAGDIPVGWASDSEALFYFEAEEPAARLRRLNLRTGKTELVRELLSARPLGMIGHYGILVTPDGSTCVFSHNSMRADLFLAEGP